MADIPVFKGPARFTIFGQAPNGAVMRVSGADTLERAKDLIALHSKSFPDMTYRIWEATWKEVKIT